RLRIQEEHVRPSGRRLALEPEMREQLRVASSPADDLQREIVDRDALLTHLVRSGRRSGKGGSTEGPRAGRAPVAIERRDTPRREGFGAAARIPDTPRPTCAIGVDDGSDSRAEV